MPAIRPRNENEPDPIVRCCMDALAGLLQLRPDQATSTLIHIIHPLLSTHHQHSRASVAKRMAGVRLIGACTAMQDQVWESMIPLALDRMRNDTHACVRVGACRAIYRHLTEPEPHAFCYEELYKMKECDGDTLIRTACEYVLLKEVEDDDVARVDEVREGLRLVGGLIMSKFSLWDDEPKIARKLLQMCCDFIVKSVQQEEEVKVTTKIERGCEAMMAVQECAKGMVNNLEADAGKLKKAVMPIITHTFIPVLRNIKIIGPMKLTMKMIKSMLACVLAMLPEGSLCTLHSAMSPHYCHTHSHYHTLTPDEEWLSYIRRYIKLHLDGFVPVLRDVLCALPELMVDEETKEMMKKIEMMLQGEEGGGGEDEDEDEDDDDDDEDDEDENEMKAGPKAGIMSICNMLSSVSKV